MFFVILIATLLSAQFFYLCFKEIFFWIHFMSLRWMKYKVKFKLITQPSNRNNLQNKHNKTYDIKYLHQHQQIICTKTSIFNFLNLKKCPETSKLKKYPIWMFILMQKILNINIKYGQPAGILHLTKKCHSEKQKKVYHFNISRKFLGRIS